MAGDGIILSKRDAEVIRQIIRWWLSKGKKLGPNMFRRRNISGEGGGIRHKIFKVHTNATGDGVYNCYEQTLDATEWNDTAGDAKFDNLNTIDIEVLNLNEFDPSAGQHDLSANDMLIAWQMVDDESNMRWVGLPIIPWNVCT